MRVIERVMNRMMPPGSTTAMTSDAFCTSERNRSSPARACRLSVRSAVSIASAACDATVSIARRLDSPGIRSSTTAHDPGDLAVDHQRRDAGTAG